MTKYRGLTELVEQTIVTAVDDGTKGTLRNISFEIENLAGVMKRTNSADRFNAAVATCEEQVHHWIIKAADNQDMEMFGHARAALALKEKLTAPRVRGYREDGNGGFTPIY